MRDGSLISARPLPTFEQWLRERVGDSRADGYEAFADFEDLIRRELGRNPSSLSDDELSFLRMYQGLGIAIVEVCQIERDKGRDPEEVLQAMPRVLGALAMFSASSIMRDETPWRSLAALLIEDFRFGAKFAADSLSALPLPDREGT